MKTYYFNILFLGPARKMLLLLIAIIGASGYIGYTVETLSILDFSGSWIEPTLSILVAIYYLLSEILVFSHLLLFGCFLNVGLEKMKNAAETLEIKLTSDEDCLEMFHLELKNYTLFKAKIVKYMLD